MLIDNRDSGRKVIYTNVREITSDNVIQVLQSAVDAHGINAERINYLIRFEAGYQDFVRKKVYRPDVDNRCVDNVASEVTEFKRGFHWANPITLVQRGQNDSGAETEQEAVSLLNEQYLAQGITGKQQDLGRFVEICGVGYTYIDINTDWQDGDAFFKLVTLDPRYTFVVRSNYYVDHRVMMGVTFSTDDSGNCYYSCFTPTQRFEIQNLITKLDGTRRRKAVWSEIPGRASGSKNPLGMVPIVEWIRDYDRMGCFERQIDEMLALNQLASDVLNSSAQEVDSIWWANDVDFEKDEDGNVRKPGSGDWVMSYTAENGKPVIQPLSPNYDYHGVLENYTTRRDLILQKCNVPRRSSTSGGSSGVAMDSANGFAVAELSASKQEYIMANCKMDEVRVVLAAIALNPYIKADNPMLKVRYSDMQASIKRQKSYELTTKINAFATGVSHGINGLHMLKAINLFEDVAQVWDDSEKMVTAYQKKECVEQRTNTGVTGVSRWSSSRSTWSNGDGNGELAPDYDKNDQDESDNSQNSPSAEK